MMYWYQNNERLFLKGVIHFGRGGYDISPSLADGSVKPAQQITVDCLRQLPDPALGFVDREIKIPALLWIIALALTAAGILKLVFYAS